VKLENWGWEFITCNIVSLPHKQVKKKLGWFF
jgi:hypothetical protein